jgi:hypothetical protein
MNNAIEIYADTVQVLDRIVIIKASTGEPVLGTMVTATDSHTDYTGSRWVYLTLANGNVLRLSVNDTVQVWPYTAVGATLDTYA